eukprot:TRINITY_DN351_c0_g1_i3.p1 TRINITY_DN351_c0_g1~~TRINITY_DN351_c0_g1_i3.p1  ORF type:complete len:566 (+),score=123.83 TRINITY_DN351_c0_g1_i3:317-2014(+)
MSARPSRPPHLLPSDDDHRRLLVASLCSQATLSTLNALLSERRKHCEDLSVQLHDLAEDYKELLGGDSLKRNARAARLREALHRAHVQVRALKEDYASGPLGLREFLDFRPRRFGPFLYPSETYDWSRYCICTPAAFLNLLLQVLLPTFWIVSLWAEQSGFAEAKSSKAAAAEAAATAQAAAALSAACGDLFAEGSIVVVAFLAITLVMMKLRLVVDDQVLNAEKNMSLPLDGYWTLTAALCGCYSCLITALVLPVIFWGTRDLEGVLVNFMVLVVFLHLDKVVWMSGLQELNEEEFQHLVLNTYISLAQCPATLRDVTKADAATLDELWEVEYAPTGQLLLAASQVGKAEPEVRTCVRQASNRVLSAIDPARLCRTRLVPIWEPVEPRAMRTKAVATSQQAAKGEEDRHDETASVVATDRDSSVDTVGDTGGTMPAAAVLPAAGGAAAEASSRLRAKPLLDAEAVQKAVEEFEKAQAAASAGWQLEGTRYSLWQVRRKRGKTTDEPPRSPAVATRLPSTATWLVRQLWLQTGRTLWVLQIAAPLAFLAFDEFDRHCRPYRNLNF